MLGLSHPDTNAYLTYLDKKRGLVKLCSLGKYHAESVFPPITLPLTRWLVAARTTTSLVGVSRRD